MPKHQCADQEQVPLHGRCVPGCKLEQTTFPEKLVSRVDHFLLSNHLIDLQQPLQALLQAENQKKLICMDAIIAINIR